MRRRATSGFTLIEVVIAITLLGAMLVLLYSGLSFAVRSWDAGDANGRRVTDFRVAQNFLRREMSEIYPMRWADLATVKYAFEGTQRDVRFISSRPAGVSMGGLSAVGIALERGKDGRSQDLVMRRAPIYADVNDFGVLGSAEASILVPGVDSVQFAYFGSENDFTDPAWSDEWKNSLRMPQMLRMSVRTARGEVLPDMVVRIMVAEEAGCFENAFQRQCRPRRPANA
jgi:general secretion pathway protein J